ncbi:MAG: ATP-dependent DNA helicase RecG [Verrucomicrobiota bacterium]
MTQPEQNFSQTELASYLPKGTRKKAKEALIEMGLLTVGDALLHIPKRYEDRNHRLFPDAPSEEPVCITGWVTDTQTRFGRGSRFFELTLSAEPEALMGGRIVCRWFNMPYVSKQFLVGQQVVAFGKIKLVKNRLIMDHPEHEIISEDGPFPEAHMGRITPIYRLKSGVNQKLLRNTIFRILQEATDEHLPDLLPPEHYGEVSRAEAIRRVHFPNELADVEPAIRLLALEEFVVLQRILLARKDEVAQVTRPARLSERALLKGYIEALPFQPTGAQSRVVEEIRADIESPHPMVRLLQGDVGAGKTLVAACAALMVIEAGLDVALMAPTQILAEQHFESLQRQLEPLGVRVTLHTGSREIGGDLPLFDSSDRTLGTLVVGTHALLHRENIYPNGLGLVIIDEQHKFGVAQRQKLIDQGEHPDVLVMTATPIPRTLTLAFYGDLEVSILDELPAGRGKIVTGIRKTNQTDDAAKFVRQQLEKGRQAYIVYPLIEESEKQDSAAVTTGFKDWQKRLVGHECGLLHGKMTADEKDAVMTAFRDGDTQVLVATSVIEVGVDVPNANIMLIYNAERFGLAQLHQLRGRIGRGQHTSFCILMCSPDQSDATERLAIMEETRDGFRIADEDLLQRGPGDVLGTQQSGLPDLRFAQYLTDHELIAEARRIAMELNG